MPQAQGRVGRRRHPGVCSRKQAARDLDASRLRFRSADCSARPIPLDFVKLIAIDNGIRGAAIDPLAASQRPEHREHGGRGH